MNRAPYGSWRSPLTAELCTASQNGFGQIAVNRGRLTIVETRAAEGGRSVLMAKQGDNWIDLQPQDFNLRTRLHEYGGLAYAIDGDLIIAVNDSDQRLYRLDGGKPRPVSPATDSRWRFAEPLIDQESRRVIAIAEIHQEQGPPENAIIALPLDGGTPDILVQGDDFYAYPRLSPDRRKLAWIAWNHPNMPWDGSRLYEAAITNDGLGPARLVDGADDVSIVQPEYDGKGQLIYASDRHGYWNLCRDGGSPIWQVEADCAGPLWQVGARWFAICDDERILVSVAKPGGSRLAFLENGDVRMLDLKVTDIGGIVVEGDSAWMRAGSALAPPSVIRLDLKSLKTETVYRSGTSPVGPSYISKARSFAFESEGRTCHAHHYPPVNADFQAGDGDKPPLIVLSHGGPTSSASTSFRLDRQFWTSRGFAICDVDYSGSAGYGRAYRNRLKGQWGVADVADCVAAARHLVEKGLADPEKLIIRGGSAGGFTVLAALTFHDVFKAGASAYGIGDLELLAGDTHKFESRYLDSLIGPYPEQRELYRMRSPIHHIDKLNTPVIFFQGLEDKVVPPNQAELMVEALRKKGVAVEYLAFDGEGHGFRRSETQIKVLLSELAFYAKILNLPHSGD